MKHFDEVFDDTLHNEDADQHDERADVDAAAGDAAGVSASDPFGLYLNQMGSIPMLKRKDELALTMKVDRLRRRYRHAALSSVFVLQRIVETFERIRAHELSLERNIDEVPSLGLTSAHIRLRLTRIVRKLRELLAEAGKAHRRVLQSRTIVQRYRRRRAYRRLLHKAVKQAEALSPRIELLDTWTKDFERLVERMANLSRRSKECQALIRKLHGTPQELSRLVQVLRARRTAYLESRRRLAEANLRLVVAIAKRYRGQGLPFADLIQEGNSGLMRAVDKFDHRLGWKFGTYATWWVRQGVTRALADSSRTVRVPSHQVGVLRAMERVRGELTVKNGNEPTLEQIAAAMKLPTEEARILHVAGRYPTSLDAGPGGDDEAGTLQELIHGSTVPDASRDLDMQLLRERLDEVLRCLPPRYREVLELRFGLNDGLRRSLDEVAKQFHVTRERVRQIEAAALDKLRQPERKSRLSDFTHVA
jgi:RNA polymerase primary sigma factor